MSENLDLEDSCFALPDGMSGADLAGVSRRAKEIAVRRHLDENPDGEPEGFEVGIRDVEMACSEPSQARVGIEAWR
jgi:SpoVK/Ycf46/Vps4 family AAA+-type ATPase